MRNRSATWLLGALLLAVPWVGLLAEEEGDADTAKQKAACEAAIKEDDARDEQKLTEAYRAKCKALNIASVPLKPVENASRQTAQTEVDSGDATATAATDTGIAASGASFQEPDAIPAGKETRLGAFADANAYPDETQKGMGATGAGATFRQGYLDMQRGDLSPKQLPDPAYAAGAHQQMDEASREERRTLAETTTQRPFQTAETAQPKDLTGQGGLEVEPFKSSLPDPKTGGLTTISRKDFLTQALGMEDARFTSGFGNRRDPFTGALKGHTGVDWAAPAGTAVRTPLAGRVISAEWNGGYGNAVEVQHNNGLITRYAHLSGYNVREGDTVEAGAVIGGVGTTGRSTGNHLHFETILNGRIVDPLGEGADAIMAARGSQPLTPYEPSTVTASRTQLGSGLSTGGITSGRSGGIRLGAYAPETNYVSQDFHGSSYGFYENTPGPISQMPIQPSVPYNPNTPNSDPRTPQIPTINMPRTTTQEIPQSVLDEAYKKLKEQGYNPLNPNIKTDRESLGINKECENLRGADLLNKPECLLKLNP